MVSTVGHDRTWVEVDYGRGDRTVCQLVKITRKWTGCWYKPWTWFRRLTIYQYEGGVWVIPTQRSWGAPKAPNKNGDSFYADRLCDPWQPMKHEERPRDPL